jgi:hypothetical protein
MQLALLSVVPGERSSSDQELDANLASSRHAKNFTSRGTDGYFVGVIGSRERSFQTPCCHDRWMMLAGKCVHHAMRPDLRGSTIFVTLSRCFE